MRRSSTANTARERRNQLRSRPPSRFGALAAILLLTTLAPTTTSADETPAEVPDPLSLNRPCASPRHIRG